MSQKFCKRKILCLLFDPEDERKTESFQSLCVILTRTKGSLAPCRTVGSKDPESLNNLYSRRSKLKRKLNNQRDKFDIYYCQRRIINVKEELS